MTTKVPIGCSRLMDRATPLTAPGPRSRHFSMNAPLTSWADTNQSLTHRTSVLSQDPKLSFIH